MENDRSIIERLRTQISAIQVELATVKSELKQLKWLLGILTGANVILNIRGIQI